MIAIPNRRILNFLGAAICAAMMGFALYAQHVLYLDPCPLCILQRIAVILLGIFFLLAAWKNPTRTSRRIYSVMLGLAAIAGAAVAAWQVRLQLLPADEVPSCGPGLNYMVENFPLRDVLGMIFKGSGECAAVAWRFLGLSMPAWVIIALLGLGIAGVWNNLRERHGALQQ